MSAPAPKKRPKPSVVGEASSLEERVRQRAHEIYVQRGDQFGSEIEDWLEAEREIVAAEEQKQSARTRIRK
jgi:hypothetical protein